MENLYPLLAALRAHQPIHRNSFGMWVLTRYDDVSEALSNRRLGNAPSPYAVVNARNRDKYICADVANNIIPFMDAPRHSEPRKTIGREFHQHLRANPIDAIDGLADSLVANSPPSGRFDVIGDLGTPLSIAVMCDLLGFPQSDASDLKAWTESFLYLFSMIPSEEVRIKLDEHLNQFREYTRSVIVKRRLHPENDLLTRLTATVDSSGGLTEAELIDNIMLLFADGIENVDSGLGNAVLALLQHPEQWELLKKHPELLPSAVEECSRYESLAQFIGRVALEDIQLNEQLIKANQAILLVLGSANRDPLKFAAADALDIRRDKNPHVAFGQGKHSCLGASLVRVEMQSAIRAIIKHVPNIALSDEPLRW